MICADAVGRSWSSAGGGALDHACYQRVSAVAGGQPTEDDAHREASLVPEG